MKSPVRPVGAPASRYREGLTAASCCKVRRMFVDANGLRRVVLWCRDSLWISWRQMRYNNLAILGLAQELTNSQLALRTGELAS